MFKEKYLKYKRKYIDLKYGGGHVPSLKEKSWKKTKQQFIDGIEQYNTQEIDGIIDLLKHIYPTKPLDLPVNLIAIKKSKVYLQNISEQNIKNMINKDILDDVDLDYLVLNPPPYDLPLNLQSMKKSKLYSEYIFDQFFNQDQKMISELIIDYGGNKLKLIDYSILISSNIIHLYKHGYFTQNVDNFEFDYNPFQRDEFKTVYLNYPQVNALPRKTYKHKYSCSNPNAKELNKVCSKTDNGPFKTQEKCVDSCLRLRTEKGAWSTEYMIYLANNKHMHKKKEPYSRDYFNPSTRHYGIHLYGILPPANITKLPERQWGKLIDFVQLLVTSVVPRVYIRLDYNHSIQVKVSNGPKIKFDHIGLPYCSQVSNNEMYPFGF